MTKPEFINPLAKAPFKARYGNFIGGEWVGAGHGQYFDNISPINGGSVLRDRPLRGRRRRAGARRRPRRQGRLGHAPAPPSGAICSTIADRMEENLEILAAAETWDNGKPIRETMAADIPLAIDHFRYFAGCIRAQEGAISRDRPRHRRLPLPRAAGRRRPDHPLELPDPDGGVEAGPGAGRRQLRGAEAGRADPGLDPGADGADRRPAAARRAQHRQRLRPGGRQAAGRPARASPRSPSPARPPPAG